MSSSQITVAPTATSRSSGVVATRIFINEVPEYSQLDQCAEKRVSSVVRGMSSGCGDGSRLTSYACFCYSSSTYYDDLIGNQIQTTCSDPAQVTVAHNVFQSYCEMGQTRGVVPASASATPTPTLSSSPSTAPFTLSTAPSVLLSTSVNGESALTFTLSTAPSASPTISSPTSSGTNSSRRTIGIAVGIIVPVVVLAALLATFFLFRSRKRRAGRAGQNPYTAELAGEKLASELSVDKYRYGASELSADKYRHDAYELPATKNKTETAELPGS